MADDISKLPAWAQKKIAELVRERETAIKQLNEYCDSQAVSEIYTDDYVSTGENQGPTNKRRYIQASTITFCHAGVELEVSVFRDGHIELRWSAVNARTREVAFVPQSFQSANLSAKENMR